MFRISKPIKQTKIGNDFINTFSPFIKHVESIAAGIK